MTDVFSTYSSITTGKFQSTTPGTAVRTTATSTPCRTVLIKAYATNTNKVVVGDANVLASTGQGLNLAPGEAIEIRIDDLNKLYIDASVGGEGAGYAYFN